MGFYCIVPDNEAPGAIALSSLYVAQRAQGKGIGRMLIDHALKNTSRNKASLLSVSVVLENKRAKGLYEKLGAVFEKEFTYYFDEYPVRCVRYIWKL